MKNRLQITINNFADTLINTRQWPITGEPERIAVRFKDREYVTVFGNPVHFEVWNLDKNGEINDLIEMITPLNYISDVTDIPEATLNHAATIFSLGKK